jgi:hypothetical protein
VSGPWDNYAPQQTAQAGPWAKYGQSGQSQSNLLSDAYRQAFLSGDTQRAHQIAVNARQQGIPIAPVGNADINQSVDQRFAQSVQSEPWYQRFTEGVGQHALDLERGIKQHIIDPALDRIAPNAGPSRADANNAAEAERRRLAAPLDATTAGNLGALVGSVASNAPLAAIPAGGATTAGRLAALAGTGALYGYLTPSASTGENITNTALGAASGPLAAGVGKGLQVAARGVASPAVQRLIAAGIKPTPGQMIGGVANRFEQALTSLPITGDIIGLSRNASMNSFNRAAINKALAPIGEKLPPNIETGQQALAWAAQRADQAFNAAKANTQARIDGPLMQQLGVIAKNAPSGSQNEVRSVIANEVLPKLSQNGGTVSGEAFQNLLSDLGNARAAYQRSAQSADRGAAVAVGNVMEALKGMYARINGPQAMQALNDARQAWRGFSTLRDATVAAGRTREGVFTPGEFLGAVKKGDKTRAKGAFGKGQAYMQDFGNDAQNVVGNTIGNSFTFDRFARSHLGGLVGGLAASPLAIPYLPGARRVTQSLLAPQVGPIRSGLAALAGDTGQRFILLPGSNGLVRVESPFAATPPVTAPAQ